MTVHFNVPWSQPHWWIFGFLWIIFGGAYAKAAMQRATLESLSRIERNAADDVFRYIERE
jgi:hypothetical protein